MNLDKGVLKRLMNQSRPNDLIVGTVSNTALSTAAPDKLIKHKHKMMVNLFILMFSNFLLYPLATLTRHKVIN